MKFRYRKTKSGGKQLGVCELVGRLWEGNSGSDYFEIDFKVYINPGIAGEWRIFCGAGIVTCTRSWKVCKEAVGKVCARTVIRLFVQSQHFAEDSFWSEVLQG